MAPCALLLCIVAYAAVGALIHSRNLPSIVVTLGLSFVWLGIAVLILPSPGGKAPDWLKSIMALQTPFIPFPIIAAIVIGLVVQLALMHSSSGRYRPGCWRQSQGHGTGRLVHA